MTQEYAEQKHDATEPSVESIIQPKSQRTNKVANFWPNELVISKNHFIHKSLSDFALNIAVGCSHGCRFCYVPDTATNKQAEHLRPFGVNDPDEDWGLYVFFRKWDQAKFLASLLRAELDQDLSDDGNRAVMLCTTTDPYQTVSGVPNQNQLNDYSRFLVRKSLELIRDCSTLNVRILTRGPLAKRDFELFKSFGNRLVFGISLPTLDDELARIYEPGAPGVKQRLATLKAAKDAGLHVYVAVAPTFPECDEDDLRRTLEAVKKLDPITIFHEPINIRAANVKRIEVHANSLGKTLKTEVFKTQDTWRVYAIEQLMLVHRIAEEFGLVNRLKLWPDGGLVAKGPFLRIRKAEFARLNLGIKLTKRRQEILDRLDIEDFETHKAWVQRWRDKVSEWPGTAPQTGWTPPPILTTSPFAPVSRDQIEAGLNESSASGTAAVVDPKTEARKEQTEIGKAE